MNVHETRMQRITLRIAKNLLIGSTILCSGLAAPAMAQMLPGGSNGTGGGEPTTLTEAEPIIDENGVDLVTGEAQQVAKSVSIGDLSYSEGWTEDINHSDFNGVLLEGLNRVVIFVDGRSMAFEKDGNGDYVPEAKDGTQLNKVGAGTNFLFIARDGSEYEFVEAPEGSSMVQNQREDLNDFDTAKLKTITRPDGEKIEWHYRSETVETNCDPVPPHGFIPPNCVIEAYDRAQSMTSNKGYMLKAEYATNTPGAGFEQLVKVTAIDRSVDYCDPDADSCPMFSRAWPNLTVSESTSGGTSSKTITDRYGDQFGAVITAGRVDEIDGDNTGDPEIEIIRYSGGKVQTVTKNGVTYTYVYNSSGGLLTVTKTLPGGASEELTIDEATKRLISSEDATGNVTSYDYDSDNRLIRVTRPEGNKVEYTYDSRSRVTTIKRIAKPGSALATTQTEIGYVTDCTNVLHCNSPLWVEGTDGNRIDYEYGTDHGQVTRVRLPAAGSGQVRAEYNYSYSELYAKVKNASGQLVDADSPIWKLTSFTSCATAATCAGTASETKVTIAYGTGNGGNNLLPTQITTEVGDGSVSSTVAYTYDEEDNILSIDGPLAGSNDIAHFIYDDKQRQIGEIGPDPDGTGPMLRRATRISYNSLDQVTMVETGTVTGTASSDLAAMTVHETVEWQFNSNNLLTTEKLVAAGITEALTQYNYDSSNRVLCRAVRMNKTAYVGLPDACTLSALGNAGFDRISKNHYNSGGRVIRTESAVGTLEASDEFTATYNPNGTLATVADGEGNKTTYHYDGFDRRYKTRFPSKTTAGTSSISDYEQLTFNALDQVTNLRRRDGQNIAFVYDDLGRITQRNLPGNGNDIHYTYDLLGRQLTARLASASGNGLTNTFDALGRLTSVTDTTGGGSRTTSYQYDAASRRSRMTWSDGFYVSYDYLTDGSLLAIKENGSTALAIYAYDARGRRISQSYGNGTDATYTYDPVSRLAILSHDLFGSTNDTTTTFQYNPAGQISELTKSNDIYAWKGHYNVDRNYTVNGLNQLTSAGAVSLSYDNRGNVSNDGTYSYSYDALNRLTSGPGGVVLSYDPYGRLHQTAGAATTRMGYDGAALIAEYNAAGVLQRRYVHGPGADDPLVWYEGSGTANKRYLHKDERGSVIAVSDSTGAMLAINTYDAYGIPDAGNLGRFQYTGQQYLPELGLYHYKARIYSPTLGRFLQADPIGYGDGMNMYAYVGGDPVNSRDPTGLADAEIIVRGHRGVHIPTAPTYSGFDALGHFSRGGLGSFGVFTGAEIIVTADRRKKKRTVAAAARSAPPQSDEGGLLRCLSDAGSGAWEGFWDPEGQAVIVAGAVIDSALVTAVDARNSARGRPSAVFGSNATIVPGSNVKLTGGQLLVRGAKRFFPGYAAASAGVALVTGGIAAYDSEACQGLFD